jgi:pimeloyl-ACP methyl ester carboxylesterase
MKHLFLATIVGMMLMRPDGTLPCHAAEPNAAQPQRPQEPKRPFPYDEEEVHFDNPRAKVTLVGTLTRPKGVGPFPAVLLVAGMGPLTRDELFFGHRPFLVLSDYLTRRGLAVLRYDKRGVGKSTGNLYQATTLNFADDAVAGMEFLKGRSDIDPKRIGAIGHSEGGRIMPILAVNWPDTAFIVILAGAATPGEEILLRGSHLMLKAKGATEEEMAKDDEILKRWCDLVKRGADGAEIERQLRPLVEAASKGDKQAVEEQMARFHSPESQCFITYSSVPALEKVRCPVLALNGEKDWQVSAKDNLRGIARALVVSGNTDFAVREMPGLNHAFQHCQSGNPSEYSKIEETMSPEVLQIVGDWILQHVHPAP